VNKGLQVPGYLHLHFQTLLDNGIQTSSTLKRDTLECITLKKNKKSNLFQKKQAVALPTSVYVVEDEKKNTRNQGK
jgi:hypothetical protein